jgi:hypothetical protein
MNFYVNWCFFIFLVYLVIMSGNNFETYHGILQPEMWGVVDSCKVDTNKKFITFCYE